MFNETKSLQWTLPVTASVAFLIARMDGFLASFFFWHFQMGFHELGHAVAGWMSGQIAIPTYGFTLIFGESNAFYILFLATLVFAIWRSKEGGYHYLMCILCLITLNALILRFVGGPEVRQMIFNIGGYAGELLLSTFFICGFYYKFPERLRWDFFRYPVVCIAFIVLFKSHMTWDRAKYSAGNLPMGGSILSETDKSDTEKLLESKYWTGRTLPSFLVKAHQVSFFLIVGHYILGLLSIPPVVARRHETDE